MQEYVIALASTPPCRRSNDGPILPPKQQATLILRQPIPLTRIQSQQYLRLSHRVRTQRHPLEPLPLHYLPPLLQPLVPLEPLRPLARHDVPYLRREYVLLHLRPLRGFRRKSGVQWVENGGVVMQGLKKTP